MQRVIDFLNENKSGVLATVEGNMPRVRPWGFMFEENGKFWFLTSNTKKVYQQLKQNPNIEFCVISPSFDHLRLSGKIEFSEDRNVKSRILEERPMLKTMYQTPDNPVLAAFYLEHGSASFCPCSSENIEVINF